MHIFMVILSIAEVQTIEFPIRLLSSIPISCSQDQTSPAVSKLILWVYSFPLEFWTTGEKLSACATGTITHQAYWLQLELTSRPRLTKRLPNPLRPISLQFEHIILIYINTGRRKKQSKNVKTDAEAMWCAWGYHWHLIFTMYSGLTD